MVRDSQPNALGASDQAIGQLAVDAIYYRDAGRFAAARAISARARAAIYDLFWQEMQPNPTMSILDVGVSDEEGPETNMVVKRYPWPGNIVCAGLGAGRQLRATYPGISYIQIAAGKPLPFRDKVFDIVCCNAVLEHVGGKMERAGFLREIVRVSRAAFITVPNRWFPFEHHTGIPFLHWNSYLFRAVLRGTRLGYWSDPSHMDFLSRRLLKIEWPAQEPPKVLYAGLRLGPLSSNLAVVAKRL
jgi:SAM-dependent methyltransferase